MVAWFLAMLARRLAAITDASHAAATGLRALTYLDYVPSKAYLVDLPSRYDYAIPRMRESGGERHDASARVCTADRPAGGVAGSGRAMLARSGLGPSGQLSCAH